MKNLRKMALIVASSPFLLLASCVSDDSYGIKLLSLNKRDVKVVSDSTERIYATKNVHINLRWLTLTDTINSKEVTPDRLNRTSDTVKIDLDGNNVGRIIYKNDDIESVEIYGWTKISRASKSAFNVQGLKGQNPPYVLDMSFTSKRYLPADVKLR